MRKPVDLKKSSSENVDLNQIGQILHEKSVSVQNMPYEFVMGSEYHEVPIEVWPSIKYSRFRS